MANEITVTTSLSVTNGNFSYLFNPGSIQVTQNTQGAHGGVITVGTSEENLSVGDVVTPGYLVLRNLDSANYVTYGPTTGGSMYAFGKIKAGETAILRLSTGTTLRWVADTATVKIQCMLLND